MCVFNFFFWKSWLAGEELCLLQKEKLKMEFCGCSDTRRAFSRACIAKCAYHKPPLRGGLAALPLRPSGSATRRRPSRRTPQSRRAPAGKRGFAGAKAACGRPGPKTKKNGISFSFRKLRDSVCWQSNAARFVRVRGPSAFPREVRGPNALEFVKQTGLVRPEIALDRAARG